MNLYEAIFKRRSVRRYTSEAIAESLLEKIMMFSTKIGGLDDSIVVKTELFDNREKQVVLRGTSKVEAPYYLVFYSQEKPGWERNAGYLLEQIVLYLTARGIGSCYLGASRIATSQVLGMKVAAVVAFGYSKGPLYRDERLVKRLSLTELCIMKGDPSEDAKRMVKAARLAPSSLNSQPWRFLVYQNKIYIFVCRELLPFKGFSSRREINIGIMMAHLMLAAEEMWLSMELKKEETLTKKNYKYGSYVVTLYFDYKE